MILKFIEILSLKRYYFYYLLMIYLFKNAGDIIKTLTVKSFMIQLYRVYLLRIIVNFI